MSPDQVIELGREALLTTLILAAPILSVATLIGLLVGLLQTISQVQDPTISTVPKIVGVLAVCFFCLPWLVEKLVAYSSNLYTAVPTWLGAG